MSRYVTPLPGLLARMIDQAFNQAIALDPSAADKLKGLNGRTVRLELKGLGIDLFFSGNGERLTVQAESEDNADTTISGSPTALLAMAVPDWRSPGSGVRIEGDAGTAQTLEKLLRQLDPDWEALLVRYFGDIIGHQLWRSFNDAAQAGRSGLATASDQVAHFLREESGLLVTRPEVDQFVRQVDELREATDRLEARLRREGRT